MKIAFTGDLVLQEISLSPTEVFGDIKDYLTKNELKLCINLESPFIKSSHSPVKEKITLSADNSKIEYLKYLSPNLINLSNNHINDYGNNSCLETQKILDRNNLVHFGIGRSEDILNLHIDHEYHYIIISYTTRSSDFSGSILFAEKDFIGPYPPDLKQISYLKSIYKDYIIIVTIHWGIEDIKYPEPEKRELAYQIIEAGADIIIGHHAHIIQAFEVYNNKYIFYSIGNFYFPEIHFDYKGLKYLKKPYMHQKSGIIPILEIKNDGIYVDQIIRIVQSHGKLKVYENYRGRRIYRMNSLYRKFHSGYYFYQRKRLLFIYLLYYPNRILKKIFRILKNYST